MGWNISIAVIYNFWQNKFSHQWKYEDDPKMISFFSNRAPGQENIILIPPNFLLIEIWPMTFTLIFFFQLTHGASLAPEPHLLEPPFDVDAGEIVNSLLLASHLLGISVNALLCK